MPTTKNRQQILKPRLAPLYGNTSQVRAKLIEMDSFLQTPLTPDQLAAVEAGGGYARFEDPRTHEIYHLIRQGTASAIDDDYIRRKLAEAQSDVDQGKVAAWNVDEFKSELRRTITGASSGR
jgi:hypothetical protein